MFLLSIQLILFYWLQEMKDVTEKYIIYLKGNVGKARKLIFQLDFKMISVHKTVIQSVY